tara:strand:+ start:1132 stop:1956 length:825 start_codon:yes stop_codon:yes gene_type:complete
MSTAEKIKEIIRRLIRKEIEEASMTGNLDGGEGPPKTPYAFQTKPKSKKDKKKEKAITTAGGYSKVDETKFHVKVDGLGDVIVNAGSKGEAKMVVGKQLKNRKDIVSVTRVQTSKAKQIDKKLENVNEVSLNPLIFSPGWEKNFKGYNEKELKVIVKLVNMSNGIAPVIKMSKKKDFKSFIKKAAQKGLHESLNEGQYHNYRNDDTMTPKQKIGLSMREVRDKLNELDKLVKINVRLKNELNVDSKTYWKRTHVAMKKISERLVKLANKVGQLY